MRWRGALIGAAVVLAMAAGGCAALPEGVDGDVTNGWAALPAAQQFRPETGTCHREVVQTVTPDDYAPGSCRYRHRAETFHVGDLTGAAASGDQPGDKAGDKARKQAFAACAAKADAFLGDDWLGGALALGAVLPGADGWRGGARWFRCDLMHIEPDTGIVVERSSSLKGALTGSAPVRLRCFDAPPDGSLRTALCGKPHDAEYAGAWTAPDIARSKLTGDPDRVRTGCFGVVATFAGLRNDSMLPYRTGLLTLTPGEDEWAAGQRGVRCFVYRHNRKLTGSVKGKGGRALPVNYA